MRNLRKFNTESEYNSATLNYPAVSWVVSGDIVHFDKETPTPSFSGLTVYYNITDISQPTQLFNGGGGSGSGSGSGSGGVLPSAMIIDGTAVEVAATYQFSTTGEHIINYSFEDNQIPESFLNDNGIGKFSTVTKVEIGDAITTISNQAFYECTSLTSVTILDSVTTIGESAFHNCSSLTSCTIGSGVTSIGQSTFYYCTSLTSVTIPDSVTSIGDNAFGGCSFTSINIPSSVTSIGNAAFNGCTSLTSVTVDSSNTVYDSRNNCNAIIETSDNKLIVGCQNTIIPDSVTSIGDGAFNYCYSITSIDIPSGVTSIGNYAFGFCSGLTSIDIPSGVTSIGNSAFYGCSGLTAITCDATTPPTLGNGYVFGNTTCPIYVPSASVETYKAATRWSSYANRIQAIP